MAVQKKSGILVEEIIAAKDTTEAIGVLKHVLDELFLTEDYLHLVALKDQLQEFSTQYGDLSDQYRELATPRSYEDLHEIRVGLNFIYRDIVDLLSFEINRVYIYYRENKTTARSQASLSLKTDEEFKKNFVKLSESLIRDYLGSAPSYATWTKCAAMSYGLYKQLESTLISIRQFTDTIASDEKRALHILQKDVK